MTDKSTGRVEAKASFGSLPLSHRVMLRMHIVVRRSAPMLCPKQTV